MNYFVGITDPQELKRRYRELCKQLHPDTGGSTEAMQILNAEYETALKCCKLTPEETEQELLHRDKIETIAHLDGLEIEIIGVWLWVGGNTYKHRETLKQSGFLFAPVKKLWFFRSDEHKTRTRGEAQDINDIRSKYGSQKIHNSTNNYLS